MYQNLILTFEDGMNTCTANGLNSWASMALLYCSLDSHFISVVHVHVGSDLDFFLFFSFDRYEPSQCTSFLLRNIHPMDKLIKIK